MTGEYVRGDEFIFSYWMAGSGVLILLTERSDELFIQTILNDSKGVPVYGISHAPLNNRDQVAMLEMGLRALGFSERVCYCDKKRLPERFRRELFDQFEIYESIMEQRQKAYAEQQQKIKEEQEKKAAEENQEESKGGLKVVEKETANP